MIRRVTLLVCAIVVASASHASAQAAAAPRAWTFDASADTYILPDEPNYVQPTIAADRDWLHLDLRFNYERLTRELARILPAGVWIGSSIVDSPFASTGLFQPRVSCPPVVSSRESTISSV